MKRLVLLSTFILISQLIQAQVKYTVLKDHPGFSDISIKPALGVEVGGAGWGASYELGVEYRKPNLPIQLMGHFRNNFFGSQNVDSERFQALRSLEIGGGYALIRKKTKKAIPVILKSTLAGSSAYYETYNIRYVNAEGNVEKQLIARGGYFNYRGNWEANDAGGNVSVQVNGQSTFMKGKLNTNGFYAGISLLNRKNLQIQTEEFGAVRKTSHSEFYFDLLLASEVSAGEYEDTEGLIGAAGAVYDIDKDSDIDKSSFGMRIGWIYNITNFQARGANGWFFKLETGTRPGIAKNQFFFLGTFGIAINKG